jgi:23S rRNA (uracil1939-C5)-methyltransferase
MRQQATIERLGHQGDGIADGPLFAPRTLPGEIITGIVEGQRLTDTRIEEPSDHRVKPPCRHYKSCGGCQLQHASDAFVAKWKVEVVQKALSAQGVDAPMRPIVTSPIATRRRAALSVRRTKKGALVGFHGRASGVITEIPDCQLLHPDLIAGLPVAEALGLLAGSRKGELTVILTKSLGGLDVAVQGGKPLDGPLRMALGKLCEDRNLARIAWGDDVITRVPAEQSFGTARVVPPPGGFLQATDHGEAALCDAVLEAVGDAASVVDLFAGSGTFSLPLATKASVYAVEGERDMLDALDHGWRFAAGVRHLTTKARDLFRNPLDRVELAKFDAAVLDPPRAGAEAQVAEVAASKINRVAYVSCNPVTFARDVATLTAAGFTVDWVQVVDQFRWSSHTEVVAQLTR